MTEKHTQSILIAGITPYFLERGALWFQENAKSIEQKAKTDPWWREHTAFIELGEKVPFSPFLRRLADLGYVKVGLIENRGEFATRGGIVDIFPINLEQPVRIEFSGNTIDAIHDIALAEPAKALKIPMAKDASEHERLWLANVREGDYLVHIDHGIGIFQGFEIRNSNIETRNKLEIQNKKSKTDFEFRASPASPEFSRGRADFEFYALEYAPARKGGMPDRLLVPRAQAKRLSRYIGFETPAIHRLGGTIWETTKRKAKEEARKFAEELMKLYRERAGARRSPYPRDPAIERELEHSFPYAETPDQIKALADIHHDLSREKPMDRLLLGDVGFGKTELAIRAAARVAYSGKQVALLAPTTILADQHFGTFQERLKKLPLAIALLTRLTSKREQKKEIEKIRNGEIDIVIGTHRLLSPDVVFRDLGLAIIDEEQRFGVKQKETFKRLRSEIDPVRNTDAPPAPENKKNASIGVDKKRMRISNGVDILALSATPIPRTLSLALAKFRAISIIQTPPPSRLPIKTYVLPFSEKIAAEAIAAELERKGQIFYLWNRIENIESVRRDLERLVQSLENGMPSGGPHNVSTASNSASINSAHTKHGRPKAAMSFSSAGMAPKTKIAVLHGRMHEQALIRVMHEFRSGAIDILLATTIIENGLDLPSVNTLIVANAARLGLSQAYQLRGRVGRGEKHASAYFLYPARSLTDKAKLRLKALKEAEGLGAGFQIALKDLEIRGAGNVLGKQQSGTMNKVGLNLYSQLLNEALEEVSMD